MISFFIYKGCMWLWHFVTDTKHDCLVYSLKKDSYITIIFFLTFYGILNILTLPDCAARHKIICMYCHMILQRTEVLLKQHSTKNFTNFKFHNSWQMLLLQTSYILFSFCLKVIIIMPLVFFLTKFFLVLFLIYRLWKTIMVHFLIQLIELWVPGCFRWDSPWLL